MFIQPLQSCRAELSTLAGLLEQDGYLYPIALAHRYTQQLLREVPTPLTGLEVLRSIVK